MPNPGFIFGQGTPDTYESLKSKRLTAERLAVGAMRAPKDLGEGLTALGQAIAYRRLMGQVNEGETKGRDAANAQYNSVLGMLLGGGAGGPRISSSGTWTPNAPLDPTNSYLGMPDVTQGGLGYSTTVDTPAGKKSVTPPPASDVQPSAPLSFGSAVMTPQQMVIAGAEARGLNPIDVATAISYETGGKFDPMITGPTTQWGTHQGLIQFGEPQAAQYGADFSSPEAAMRSQLDPKSGAVWNYLDQTGVKPGMGLDNIYSAINAGAPGRFNASDAGNGGAPGTVADKVAGMGDHRATAAQWLGGTWTPDPNGPQVTMSTQSAPGGDLGQLTDLLSNPYLSEGQQSVLGAILQQRLAGMDPANALDLQLKQAQLEAARKAGTAPIEVGGVLLDPNTYQPIYDSRGADTPASVDEYNFARSQGYQGSFVDYQTEKAKAGATNVQVGGNDARMGTVPPGYVAVQDPNSPAGYTMQPIPGGPADATKTQQAKTDAADTVTGTITTAAARAREAAGKRTFGAAGTTLAGALPWTDSAEVMRQVGTLKSIATIETLNQMRQASPTGGALGNVTEGEGKMLAAKAGALDPNSPNFVRDLNDYELTLLKTVHGPEVGQKIYDATHNDSAQTSDADLFSKYGISP